MNNSTNSILSSESGERLSFYKLFNEKDYRIEIPIIQRDYAQGRKSKYEVRNLFLESLYKYLDANIPNQDLDFVYGSINKIDGVNYFIPLDGQQRLTTLFLLHWYLANTIDDNYTNKYEDFRNLMLSNEKSKFRYETRPSSSEFCDSLVKYSINFSNLQVPDKDKNNSISKTIINSHWFYISWQFDPTIQSMLVMLDAIHEKFCGKTEFYSCLIDKDRPVITFLFLNLAEFKLTDDLYIKMNSRGKPLTEFENFKAKFEEFLSDLDKKVIKEKKFKLNFNMGDKEVSLRDYFSYKIDAVWTNLFWQYRSLISSKNKEEDNDYDDELMNFMRIIFTSQYASFIDTESDDNLEYLVGTQKARNRKDYSDTISFSKYKELNSLSLDSVFYLIDTLDCLYNGESKIKTYLKDNFYFNENETFEKLLQHELSFPQRVQFHAYIQFLIINSSNINGLHQWMRFIHNLTENTIIDGTDQFVKAIKFVNKILPRSIDIIEFLTNSETINDSIFEKQLSEEIIKAHLFNISDEWKIALEHSEKLSFFKGQIGFILDFSGIISFYDENKNCKWKANENEQFFYKFVDYGNKASGLFEIRDGKQNSNFILERAILSKGNYLIPASNNRYNFSSSRKVKNYERDFSWKKLLRELNSKRSYIKEVLDDPDFDVNIIEASLGKIIEKNKVTDWRKYFIEKPELIRYCNQGFIHINSEYNIILLKESQLNHYHSDLFSFVLSENCKENLADFKPFEKCKCHEVKSGEDYSYAIFTGCNIDNKDFCIEVYYELYNTGLLQYKYEVRIFSKDIDNITNYDENIRQLLEGLEFEWKENEWFGFWLSFKQESEAVLKIKEFCARLNTLLV